MSTARLQLAQIDPAVVAAIGKIECDHELRKSSRRKVPLALP
jgi:hypothetical protein